MDHVGVLVLAHGGSSRWNGMIRQAVKSAALPALTEVALGMGSDPHEVRRLQTAITRLERQGARRIVVVPLLVSSYSEVFRQFEYLFGLRPEAPWKDAGKPLALEVPIVMGRALDDSPVVAEILVERARRLSQRPREEIVILVAHGPNEEADNRRWLTTMQRLADGVKQAGGFHDVIPLTMRDDAPPPIHDQAALRLRETVKTATKQGRVLVIPVLVARGGVEHKIPTLLAGLPFAYTGDTLLPHDKLVAWIAEQARQLASRETQGGSVQEVPVVK